jgi:hypothetical protein
MAEISILAEYRGNFLRNQILGNFAWDPVSQPSVFTGNPAFRKLPIQRAVLPPEEGTPILL